MRIRTVGAAAASSSGVGLFLAAAMGSCSSQVLDRAIGWPANGSQQREGFGVVRGQPE